MSDAGNQIECVQVMRMVGGGVELVPLYWLPKILQAYAKSHTWSETYLWSGLVCGFCLFTYRSSKYSLIFVHTNKCCAARTTSLKAFVGATAGPQCGHINNNL